MAGSSHASTRAKTSIGIRPAQPPQYTLAKTASSGTVPPPAVRAGLGSLALGAARGRLLLASEAFALLLLSRAALRLVPMRLILGWLERRKDSVAPRAADPRRTIRDVCWAVEAVARHSRVRFVCFPQSLAGSMLLHRRGVASTLHYGVARVDGKLVTHTWLEAGGRVVLGAEEAAGFTLLSSH